MAIRRAKIIDQDQLLRVLDLVREGEHALRDEIALRLSFFAGLRAQEIAYLRWKQNVITSDGEIGDVLYVTSDIGKCTTEREIPIADKLRELLVRLRQARPKDIYVFYRSDERTDKDGLPRYTPNAVAQWFRRLYAEVGFNGCSSHSGRRTFITDRARTSNLVGCSIVDVQKLVGHRRLETTAVYIEPSPQQRELVNTWAV